MKFVTPVHEFIQRRANEAVLHDIQITHNPNSRFSEKFMFSIGSIAVGAVGAYLIHGDPGSAAICGIVAAEHMYAGFELACAHQRIIDERTKENSGQQG